VQQVTLGAPGWGGESFSLPIISCTAEALCWIAWYAGSSNVIALGTLDVETLAVTPVTTVRRPEWSSEEYRYSCTATGCTLAIATIAMEGRGYDFSIILVPNDGTAQRYVQMTVGMPIPYMALQRLDGRSVFVWINAHAIVRTVVCH
jgi:hypothetical protein